MAIVRTASTSELAVTVSEGIFDALKASEEIYGDAMDLNNHVAAGGGDGSVNDGALSWTTAKGADSIVYTGIWDDYRDSFRDHFYNATEKYSFFGSNLNGAAVDGAQSVSRFTLSKTESWSNSAPGYLYDEAQSYRSSAALGLDLATPTTMTIGNFSIAEEARRSESGYSDGIYETGWAADSQMRSKSSSAFVGSAVWDMDLGLTNVRLKSYLQSHSSSGGGYGVDVGIARAAAPATSSWSASGSFSLVGTGDGLSASFEDGYTWLDGGIASLTLSGKWSESYIGEEGAASYSSLEYYRYVNGVPASDDLDLSVLENYVNSGPAKDAAWDALVAAEDDLLDVQNAWIVAAIALDAASPGDADYQAKQQAFDEAQTALGLANTALAAAQSAYDAAVVAFDSRFDMAYAELFRGNDTISISTTSGGYVAAGAGADKVIGGKGGDEIYGDAGADNLNGGDGWDEIHGGADNDVLKGGNGDDRVFGEDGADSIDGGAGNDTLSGGAGNDRILGGAGNDRIDGDEGNDTLDGGTGHDLINGGAGNDQLKGGAGQDVLLGGGGDDILDGGAGNDLLKGGAGRDVMTGGSGIDGFGFALGDSGDGELTLTSLDRITDFNVAQDRLQLLTANDSGNMDVYVLTGTETQGQLGKADSYEALLNGAMAVSLAGEHYVVGYDNGNTYFFADLDGDGNLDIAIQLVGIKGDAVAHALVIDCFVSGA